METTYFRKTPPPAGPYRRRLLYALIGAGVLSLFGADPTPAQQPQPACAPKDQVRKILGKEYGERPVAQGATDGGALLEVYASESGGWSITITRNGMTCLVQSGEGWEFVFSIPKGEGA